MGGYCDDWGAGVCEWGKVELRVGDRDSEVHSAGGT